MENSGNYACGSPGKRLNVLNMLASRQVYTNCQTSALFLSGTRAAKGILQDCGQRLFVIFSAYHLASIQAFVSEPRNILKALILDLFEMSFPERVVTLRKQKGWTQQQLADEVGVRVLQIRRYESGASQPTLDVIRRLALALGATTDELIFGKDERGPDEELRLQFEAISRFTPEEKKIAKAVLESLILKHDANRFSASG